MFTTPKRLRRAAAWLVLAAVGPLFLVPSASAADCAPCTTFASGTDWGVVSISALTEASGIAASRANERVLWTHNDGSRQRLFAIGLDGALLSTFNLNHGVDDVEDVAVGPGPALGVSYLYVGDIGGSAAKGNVRSNVNILRIAEPVVDASWSANPRSLDFAGVQSFTLHYPDGAYDAEALLCDPVSGDLLIITKDPIAARVYRANIAGAAPDSITPLQFVGTVDFTLASGGDISLDGTQIVLRREDAAVLWTRCDGEPVMTALSRSPVPVPVIGLPVEPNGEAIAFLPHGEGYVTISEGSDPTLYFFQSQCPTPPVLTRPPADLAVLAGQSGEIVAEAVGFPAPVFRWYFNNEILGSAESNRLVLTNVALSQAGTYSVTASNSSGVVTGAATLTVRIKPDLRITEVQPSQASGAAVPTADWWELTSFETQPVQLNGWRFNDNSGGLSDPYTIGEVTIQPRESIIFVEGLTAEAFKLWWGATNLPPNIQIIDYSGNGLGLGNGGDGLRLWTQIAASAADTVAAVDFGAATAGVTFNYDPLAQTFGSLSVLGVNGVFKAASSNDIGSPGRINSPASAPVLHAQRSGGQLLISLDATAGHRYTLQSRADAAEGVWNSVSTFDSITNGPINFTVNADANAEFYRVIVVE